MGQSIQVVGTAAVNDVVIFAIDRGLTGMDSEEYNSAAEAAAGDGFGALLATRLFASVDGIDRVFVAGNDVLVQRPDGWDEASRDDARSIIEDLFRFYPD